MVALSYSIVPAALVAILKLRMGDPVYSPILICILVGLLNEIISTIVISNDYSNAANNNIFHLLETNLILFQFKKWKLFSGNRLLFIIILVTLGLLWLWENRSLAQLNLFEPFFRCLSAFIIVTMSIVVINKLIITHEGRILDSPSFLFCSAFILYFCSVIVIEIFLYFIPGLSVGLRDAVFKAGITANVITNLIYLIAILWIRRKPRYIMQ
jgi:hypothetical protein